MSEPLLFSPLTIRGVELRNRIVVPPKHQYSAVCAERPFRTVPPQFGYWLGTRPSTWQNGREDTKRAL